jgi:undecaprenyl-diphosphatase
VSAISRREFADPDLRLATWIVLATIPIALAGALLSSSLNTCNSPLRALPVIGWACILMAVLMALTEILARHRRSVENASLVDALLVGLAQVGALIPGVSRSGSTLTAALALGFKREEAARFSFLLGIPAIALAGLKELWELHKVHLDMHGWSILAVGLGVATVSAFAALLRLALRHLSRSAWRSSGHRDHQRLASLSVSLPTHREIGMAMPRRRIAMPMPMPMPRRFTQSGIRRMVVQLSQM